MNEQQTWDAYQREAQKTQRLFADPAATPAERSQQMLRANAAHRVYMASLYHAPGNPRPEARDTLHSRLVVHGVLLFCAIVAFAGLALPAAVQSGGWLAAVASLLLAGAAIRIAASGYPLLRRYHRSSDRG